MSRALIALLALLMGVSHVARAEEPAGLAENSFLVQRLGTAGIEAEQARGLEESLVLALGRRQGVRVVTPAELEQTLQLAQLSTELGCDSSEECLAEVRNKLAVSTILSGKVGRLGKEVFLTLALVDARHGSVRRRITMQAESMEGLTQQMEAAVDQVLGRAAAVAPFRRKQGETLELAVMPLAARGIAETTVDAMTQILSAELNQIEGVSVISRDDIRAMLDKGQLEAEMGCTDNLDCIVEIGAALGLSKLVAGSVGKIGDSYVISMQLIDTKKAQVDNRVVESFVGAQGELKNAVKLAAYQLIGVDYQPRRGALKLSFNVEQAEARLGERRLKVHKSHLDVLDLTPGRYSLQVNADADDFDPFQTDIYVAPGMANVQTVRLRAKPTRWYKSWWFWTTTGVAVAGSGALSAYLLTRGEVGNGSGTATIMGAP